MVSPYLLLIAISVCFSSHLLAELEEFIHPEDKRYETFRLALELMEKRKAKVIVETGTARDGRKNCTGDGCSTPIFGAWAAEHGAFVYSVDIDPEALVNGSEASFPFSAHLRFVNSDSVQFLKDFRRPIDFLYLDSYDFDYDNPLPSQEHHLHEIMAAYPCLTDRSIVLIDDCDLPHGGKGRLAIEWLLQKGWEIVAEKYQVLLMPRQKNPISFKEIPKAELHLHLGGSYPLSYLLSLASEEEGNKLKETLRALSKGVEYHDVFQFFEIVRDLINSEERVEKGVEALCHTLQEDGVTFAEIRTGLKDLGRGTESYLNTVLRGMAKGTSDHFIPRLLLSLQRSSSISAAQMTVELALKYRDQGVVGIDISGDAAIGEIDKIMPELLRAKDAGIPFVVHIGETLDEVGQLELLEALEPVRIGHGVHLTFEAESWILEHRTPIEVCLTSSVLAGMVKNVKELPALRYHKEGCPIIFCSDDPLLFSTTLSKEYEIAQREWNISEKELEKIAKEAFQYALIE